MTTINIQSWFILFDIVCIICCAFAILLAMIFLFTIINDKTCHTVPIMLVANSCLVEFMFGIVVLLMAIYTLRNDFKSISYYDASCLVYGYASYVVVGIQNYSYLLQAIYRYISIVYPARVFYRSMKFQFFLISISWICGVIYPIPIVLTNQIQFHIDDQICQMPLVLSFLTIFNATYIYFCPMGLIIFIYIRMVRYVRKMSQCAVPVNRLFHAQRELKLIQRIVILVSLIASLGFPYAVFIVMSFFNRAPQYHFRIAYIFINVSLVFILIALFIVTEPLRISLIRLFKRRSTAVLPVVS